MIDGTYSTPFTPFYKYVPPLAWIILMGLQTRSLFLHPDPLTIPGIGGVAPPGTQWVVLVVWLVGTAFLLWAAYRAVSLRIAGGQIYIRQFWREEHLDPKWLRDVDELWSIRPGWVTIGFVDQAGRSRRVWVYTDEDLSKDLAGTLEKLMNEARAPAA